MQGYKFLVVIAFLGVLTGCVSPDEQVRTISLDGKWVSKYPARFEFDIQDAQNPKNIIFVIRNNNEYPYMNLRLEASVSKINEKGKATEILNYMLAEPNGIWTGTGFGATKETLGRYKMNYRFPGNGKYKIELKHLMFKSPLTGLEDIGIKIETVKP